MLFPIMGPSSLPVVLARPDESHAYKTASVLERYSYNRPKAIRTWFKRRWRMKEKNKEKSKLTF